MVFREEIIGDCRLILGDCMEVMPTLDSFDAVVTDPPYSIERFKNGIGKNDRLTVKADNTAWNNNKPSAELFNKILSVGTEHIIWGANNFTLPESEYFFVWDKQQTVDNFASAELAYSDIKQPAKVFRLSIHKHNQVEKFHPTQKPVELMEWCLSWLKTSGAVLDPFMGSGTTGVACAKMGRTFTGIELEQKYFDIACKRIEEAYQQPDMFIEQRAKEPPQETVEMFD